LSLMTSHLSGPISGRQVYLAGLSFRFGGRDFLAMLNFHAASWEA